MYGSETWSDTLSEEYTYGMFKNRVVKGNILTYDGESNRRMEKLVIGYSQFLLPTKY